MRARRFPALVVLCLAVASLTVIGAPAAADHTNPREQLVPILAQPAPSFLTQGVGTWTYIRGFNPNPGTDHKFFSKAGSVYASSGSLGQGDGTHVGQRVLRLTNKRLVQPEWVADHGSAACTGSNPGGTTGLQHDAAVTPSNDAELIIDSTDATSRCHDPSGGGLELIDVSRINRADFEPREVHLTRHAGTSHTVTVDATRPWIVYNSSSDFAGRPWIDVLDIRTCLGNARLKLQDKRAKCRPQVYRIPFEPDWSRQRDLNGNLVPGSEAACHDITATPGRIYCAGLNATLIFDVSGLTDATGAILGSALPCTVIDGTGTAAKVTDCSMAGASETARAEGWQFLGTFNHPGRNPTNSNTNLQVRADQGVAVSHESDPSPNGQYMFVTDERGGGVVPPGASCTPGLDNPYGNGGIHVFDISDPSNPRYAQMVDGRQAVWISDAIIPAATFCTVHVIEHIPDEQRLIVAYYSQGAKVLDYFIDDNGNFAFRETASMILPGANTWAVTPFKTVDNRDGTRTYYLFASDIDRGIDIYSWTGPKNPMGAKPPQSIVKGSVVPFELSDVALLVTAAVVLPAAVYFGRRRRSLVE